MSNENLLPTKSIMKKIYCLSVGLLMLSYVAVWGQSTAQIAKTDLSPVIDGDIEATWDMAAANPIANLSNAGDGDSTVTASWRALWDAENIYFLFEVMDDTAVNSGTYVGPAHWYLHDCMEVFVDMNNSKADSGVSNSEGLYQLRFIYGLDAEPMYENPTMTGYENVSKEVDDGYVIEVKMPWSNLITGMPDSATIAQGIDIGLDFKVTDIDESVPQDSWWTTHYEYVWNNAADKKMINFGTVKLVPAPEKVVISPGAPTIDGDVDDSWSLVDRIPIANLANAGDGDSTVTGFWRASWDDDNLYMLFEVEDDVAVNSGTYVGPAHWYLHDCIEVFVDMNNNKADSAVSNSDGLYQLRFIYGLDDEPIYENPDMTGYENVSKDTDEGYNIEVKMPWSVLSEGMTDPVTIEEGLQVGIDFKVTDIDEAVPADSWWVTHYEYVWNNAADKKMSNFGTIELAKPEYKKAMVWSTNNAPTIDGDIDPIWDVAEANPIDNLANPGDGDPTVSGAWKVLWDADNIYFLFDIEDDVAVNSGTYVGPAHWYLHDCMEVFVDMANTKADSAVFNVDGQYQLRFIYDLDDEPIYENPNMTGYENASKFFCHFCNGKIRICVLQSTGRILINTHIIRDVSLFIVVRQAFPSHRLYRSSFSYGCVLQHCLKKNFSICIRCAHQKCIGNDGS